MRSILAKFSFEKLAVRQSKVLLENQDIDLLEKFGKAASALTSLSISRTHQLYSITEDAKRVLVDDEAQVNPTRNLTLLNECFSKKISSIKAEALFDETSLRLHLARSYFDRLKIVVVEKDIGSENLNAESIKRLLDVVLLGTSSERVEEHIKLYGPTISQARLQDCFYSLLEPEVETASSLLLRSPGLHKHHVKGVPAFAKSYLLDKLEVNMRTRCVLAWADPAYTGFKPLPDDHVAPVHDLIVSRNQYFKDCVGVGKQFVADVVGKRRQFYADKLENRITMLKGGAFFVVTCLLDWLVTSL